MSISDPPKSPERLLKRSSIGLISIAPGILSLCAIVVAFAALSQVWTYRSDSWLPGVLFIASPILALFLSGIGIGLGCGGLIQRGSNRLFALAGLLLSSLACSGCLLLALFFFIMSGGGMGF